MTTAAEIRGRVLYDDSCGSCRRRVPFWSGTVAKRGVAIETLRSKWVQASLGAQPVGLLQDLRLLLVDGS
jgi:hypothetical protein